MTSFQLAQIQTYLHLADELLKNVVACGGEVSKIKAQDNIVKALLLLETIDAS